ncbi:class I SAM-dependent methyltransferase [Mycobacteroides saopaulense]|uniref:class I SAM-dependent methyltransferase n=1 Tax=Mycobacteroides saopaulense TaxID=1578165 RepID=UPI0012FF97D8|nr:class I SAM-dependent methyltransferase [Mycobacteroides saopaulense]
MLPNEHWLFDEYRQQCASRGRVLTALDFGCGNGRLITHSQQSGDADFWGADTYYGEGEIYAHDGKEVIPETTRQRIKLLEPGKALPFDDHTFDFVCSNQVLEHVEQLDGVVDELARITKPGGVHIHLFPTKELISEAHLGVPYVHRLPPRYRERWSRAFYPRARFADTTSSFDEWWTSMGPFLEHKTFYRGRREYDRALARRFHVAHVEPRKLNYHLSQSRLRRMRGLTGVLPVRTELMRVGAAVRLELREAA